MKKYLLCSLLVFFTALHAQSQSPKIGFPSTNGIVYATELAGDSLFAGGNFSRVFHPDSSSQYGVTLTKGRATISNVWAKPNSAVTAVTSDGNKGFYIAGNFWRIGDSVRYGIAHIDSNGAVLPHLANMGADGTINTLKLKNDTLYAGGFFNRIGPMIKSGGAGVDSNGNLLPGFGEVNGSISAVVADGKGGWYIGGTFTQVNKQPRPALAHLDSAGNLLPFAPMANGSVTSLLLNGNTLYVSGLFSYIGGKLQRYLAAVDVTTGLATDWNPNINSFVAIMRYDNGLLYAGGAFTQVGSATRRYLAAIDTLTGLATAWNPSPNNAVRGIEISGDKVYLGGSFDSLGGKKRWSVGCVDKNTGLANNWNPNPNSAVWTTLLYNDKIFVGGGFTTIGGASRQGVALVDTITGLATSWIPPSHMGIVQQLILKDSTLYIGGSFKRAGGNIRMGTAAVNARTGVLTGWQTNASSTVFGMSFSGSRMYIGGAFEAVGGEYRQCLGAINTNTEAVTSLDLDFGTLAYIYALDFYDDDILVGGYYQQIGGQTRNCLASVNRQFGFVNAWNPNPDYTVRTILVSDTTVYFGGEFHKVGTVTRNFAAAVSARNAALLAFHPNLGGAAADMKKAHNKIYIGGSYTNSSPPQMINLAAFDPVSGIIDLWNAKQYSSVNAIEIEDTLIYVASYDSLIAISTNTGVHTSWNPFTNIVLTIALGKYIYAGGGFLKACGYYRNSLVCINTKTYQVGSWNPGVDKTIYSLESANNRLYVGGDYTRIGGLSRNNFAAIDIPTGQTTPFTADANNIVRALRASGNTLYAGGSFTSLASQTRNHIAAIDMPSGTLNAWDPNANATVRVFELSDTTLYVGGDFTNIGGQNRRYLGALSANTGSTSSWNPNPNKMVAALLLDDTTLYMGGNFDTIQGIRRNKIAAINVSTTQPTSFVANADKTVWSLTSQGNNVYAGGEFYNINGRTMINLASLNRYTGAVSTIWSGNLASGSVAVYSLAADSNAIYGGGNFGLSVGASLAAFPVDFSFNLETDKSNYCPGDSLKFSFDIYPPAVSSANTFTIELSNNAGRYTNPLVLAVTTGLSGASISAVLPDTLSSGGNYHIRVKVSTGAVSSDSAITIRINPAPKAGFVLSGSAAQCLRNNSFTFNDTSGIASGTYTRSWDFGDGDTASTSAVTRICTFPGIQTIKLKVVSDMGCADSASQDIMVYAQPEVTLLPLSDTGICPGGQVLLTAQSDTGLIYYWFHNDIEVNAVSGSTYLADSAGAYKVAVVNTNGCTDTSAVTQVTVYPRPEVSLAPADTAICEGMNVTILVMPDTGLTYRWFHNDILVDEVTTEAYLTDSAGAYKVIATNAHQCSDTSAAAQVTVYPRPEVSITPGDVAICSGSTITFKVISDTGLVYQWLQDDMPSGLTDDTLVTGFPASYRVVGISAHGCADTSAASEVTVNPVPATGSITGNTSVNEGDVETYSVAHTGGSVYQWLFTSGTGSSSTQSIDITWTASGNTTLQVVETNSYGCAGDTVSLDITIAAVMGVPGISSGTMLRAYPNPAQGKVYIEASGFNHSLAKVYNALGQLVAADITLVQPGLLEVNLSACDNGMYTVVLADETGRQAMARIMLSRK